MEGGNKGTDQQTGWLFRPGGASSAPPDPTSPSAGNDKDSVEWTASEYIAHEKHAGWYVQAILASIVVAFLIYLITRDMVSAGVILFAGLVFAIVAARKPRVIAYRVDQNGLTVGQKYYSFSQFKSYVAMQDGPLLLIMFVPHKRFMPTIDVYAPPDNAEAILGVLSNSLPFETRKPSLIDAVAKRIRF